MKVTNFEDVVALLNELLVLDREAISKIYTTRFNCSSDLDKDSRALTRNDGHPTISGLGILNALLDLMTDNSYRIGVEFNWEANLIDRFVVVKTEEVK